MNDPLPIFLTASLAVTLGAVNLFIWRDRARRVAKWRRRQVMKRHRLIDYPPGAVGTGCDDDPYLAPFARWAEKAE